MSKTLKYLLFIVIGFFVLYTLVGFIAIPWAIKTQLPPKLSETLQRQVFIREASFNPFLLTLQVEDFDILEHSGTPLIGFDELFIDFELAPLVTQTYTFSEIRLVLPYGLVEVRPDSSMNVVDLVEALESDEEEGEQFSSEESTESEGLPLVYIEKFSIQQGLVEFRDFSHRNPFVAHMVPINLTLEQFSTKPGETNPYKLSAEFQNGATLNWEGSLTLEPVFSEGTLALEGIRLDHFWKYLEDRFRFDISEGTLNLAGQYRVENTEKGFDTQIHGGNLTIQDLRIVEQGAEDSLISIPTFAVQDVSIDVLGKHVTIPRVRVNGSQFIGWVDAQGVMNYQTLFEPIAPEAKTKVVPVETARPSGLEEKSWGVIVQDLLVENFSVDFEDRQPASPVNVSLTSGQFHTTGISTTFTNPLPIDLSMVLNEKGTVQVKGEVKVEPLAVTMDLNIANVTLKPFQGYLGPFVQFDVGSGALNLRGKTHFQTSSTTQPRVTYDGSVSLANLKLVDHKMSKPFMKWDELSLKQLVVKVEPTSVQLGKMALRNPFVFLVRDGDGELNLARVFSPPGQKGQTESESSAELSSEAKDSPSPPIKVGEVLLENLQAQFTDQSISPSVVTRLEEVSGAIKGLSSEQIAKADVALTGKIDRYAPFSIKGKINPLSEDAYTDLDLKFKNLNLTTVSPYSGKFAGYPITKGKLYLDLGYKVSEKTLVGKNNILVDQLTMGSPTNSPDAPSLPIPLALALLKDRKAQISIDLPVRGNLDDPEFSYWGLVFQALGNLLTKVAASPFNLVGGLVGSLIPGGEEALKYVEFSPGNQSIPATEQEKLSALAKALMDRPGLRLEITGSADERLDARALAEKELLNLMRKAKFLDPSTSSEPKPDSIDEIELTEAEENQYLKKFYTEKFGSPASSEAKDPATGKSQEVTVDEMRQRLIQDRAIGKEQLRLLAQERAQQIREYIVQEGQIPGERVFLLEVNLAPVTQEETIQSPLSLGVN